MTDFQAIRLMAEKLDFCRRCNAARDENPDGLCECSCVLHDLVDSPECAECLRALDRITIAGPEALPVA